MKIEFIFAETITRDIINIEKLRDGIFLTAMIMQRENNTLQCIFWTSFTSLSKGTEPGTYRGVKSQTSAITFIFE